MCGGTSQEINPRCECCGLSPRVRGNHDHSLHRDCAGGSIPACAGEPRATAHSQSGSKVYPRVCGGTAWDALRPLHAGGLSPRVRGNQAAYRPVEGPGRSIPACAGEPGGVLPDAGQGWVYPRVCGGTLRQPLYDLGCQGLSPRVRGNLHPHHIRPFRHRSIPACAGEPSSSVSGTRVSKVYPRVCGGTRLRPHRRHVIRGLSPRVRGNPLRAYPNNPAALRAVRAQAK